MLKKCLLISSVFALTTGMAAAGAGAYPYVGAGLGITANTATTDTFGSYRGVPLNVFMGFGGVVYQSLFIAGELGANLITGELSNQGAVKTSYGYGASILPGFELCDHTIIFGRLGVIRTHFSQVRVPTTSTTANLTGGQFGAGIQTALTQNIDIRGEYDFIDYGSLSAGGYSAKPRSDIATASLIYKFE
jgi:opacity protein-like surface antigen